MIFAAIAMATETPTVAIICDPLRLSSCCEDSDIMWMQITGYGFRPMLTIKVCCITQWVMLPRTLGLQISRHIYRR